MYLTQPNNTTAGQKLLLSASLPYDPPNGYLDGQRQRWKISIKERGFVELQSRYHSLNAPDLVVAVGSEIGINNGTNIEQRLRTNANGKYLWRVGRSTGTPLRAQEEMLFCWLASAEMETETHGYDLYTQAHINVIVHGSTLPKGGSMEKAGEACWYFTDKALDYVGWESAIPEDLVRFCIDNGNPIIIGRKTPDVDDGHVTVVVGYYFDYLDWTYKYYVNDPWQYNSTTPRNGSVYIRSFDNLIGNQTHQDEDVWDGRQWQWSVTHLDEALERELEIRENN